MDSTELRRLVPHYVAVMVLVFVVVAAVDALAGIPFWVGVVIALGVGAVYRPLVVALGVAPEPWREE